jgi:hypothetical protein
MIKICQYKNGKCIDCLRPQLECSTDRACRPMTGNELTHPPQADQLMRVRDGLGDYTERLLKKLGITPERYVAAKEFAGLAPTCNCAARKQWLNKVGEWWVSVSAQLTQRIRNH